MGPSTTAPRFGHADGDGLDLHKQPAVNDGGAIDDNGESGGSGTLTVTDSTFKQLRLRRWGHRQRRQGGSGTLMVTDSTFTNNTAANFDGGAIDNGDYYGSGTLTVTDSTFTNNTAPDSDGGAIDNGDVSDGGTGNVVVAADIFAGSCLQGTGTWTDDGYNVGSDTSCQTRRDR